MRRVRLLLPVCIAALLALGAPHAGAQQPALDVGPLRFLDCWVGGISHPDGTAEVRLACARPTHLLDSPNATLSIATSAQLTALHQFADSVKRVMAETPDRGATRLTYRVAPSTSAGKLSPIFVRSIDYGRDVSTLTWKTAQLELSNADELSPLLLVADSAMVLATRAAATTGTPPDTTTAKKYLSASRALGLAESQRQADSSAALTKSGSDGPFVESSVDKQATLAPSEKAPPYPQSMLEKHLDGDVAVRFIVDTTGRADMKSLQVVKSTNSAFTDAVRQHLPSMRFVAAEIDGKKVREWVSMPFIFGAHLR